MTEIINRGMKILECLMTEVERWNKKPNEESIEVMEIYNKQLASLLIEIIDHIKDHQLSDHEVGHLVRFNKTYESILECMQ